VGQKKKAEQASFCIVFLISTTESSERKTQISKTSTRHFKSSFLNVGFFSVGS